MLLIANESPMKFEKRLYINGLNAKNEGSNPSFSATEKALKTLSFQGFSSFLG